MDEPALAAALLDWYRRHRRNLPWREAPTPYTVLLSELLCQQTRVDTAIPYFHRFLARWPTLADLAAADEADVIEAWAGLGYYRRARHLLAAARAAHAQGGLPSEAARLRELPGIGAYTAGAIAAVAFGRREPAVDGNVERVLSRLDARRADPRSKHGRLALEDRARALVEAASGGDNPAGDLVQGLMELGATVCTPRRPACDRCPWLASCAGRAIAEDLPNKAPKKPPVPVYAVAGLLVEDGRVLLGRRPAGELLGGLWEPIGGPVQPDDAPREAIVGAFLGRAGLAVRVERELGVVVHLFSHRRLTATVFAVTAEGSALAEPSQGYDALRWAEPETTGLSAFARKVLALRPG